MPALSFACLSGTQVILGACGHRGVLACLPARDIVCLCLCGHHIYVDVPERHIPILRRCRCEIYYYVPAAWRRLPGALAGALLSFACLSDTQIILGACEYCDVLACSPVRDIVLFVPLQAPYSLFQSTIGGHLGYVLVPVKAIGVLFCAAAEQSYFCCAARHVVVYLSAMIRHFLFVLKVLAAPPRRRVAAPAWVIRVALRSLHFIVQRVAALPDWARCGAFSGIWSASRRVNVAHCGACLFMRSVWQRLLVYGAAPPHQARCGESKN